jgi:hypothetical protein
MFEQTATFPSGMDRRNPRRLNRLRRFLNDYWLIPVLICYLQLSTQVIFPADPPLERLYKGNRTFIQGIPIAYRLATDDFPYTLIGHLHEMVDHGFYKFDIRQVPHVDLKAALASPESRQEIYDRLVASRKHHQSELGGLLTVSYLPTGPVVRLHEVRSLNEIYFNKLKTASGSVPQFVAFLSSKEDREILEKVGLDTAWLENIISIMKSDRITSPVKERLIQSFLQMYEILSDSRYLLSPYQFKEALGRVPFGERFIGLYHFHNGLNEPPSEVDIEQSLRKRQIVMTLSQKGWTLYDVEKQKMEQVDLDIEIDKRVSLQ